MRILVLRFSAMGDVAILSVVMRALLLQNEEVEIFMLSRPQFEPLFPYQKDPRFTFIGADFKNEFKGTKGVYKLYKQLSETGKFDSIFDMHDVMRSWGLSTLLTLRKAKVFRIDKGRANKKRLTKKLKKNFAPLKTTIERYAEVCRSAGLKLDLDEFKMPALPFDPSEEVINFLKQRSSNLVGCAPFAKHKAKMYPIEKMENVIQSLANSNRQVLLFGGGQKETTTLNNIATLYENVFSVAGKFTLPDELYLMSKLEYMLCMDSANMHMAALVGTEIYSIWGATHPFAGFIAFGQKEQNLIQISRKELNCRPCSVYGNKSCWRGDYACLETLNEAKILKKITD